MPDHKKMSSNKEKKEIEERWKNVSIDIEEKANEAISRFLNGGNTTNITK